MRAEFEGSHKFGDPFTAWLYQVSLDGCDDEYGSVDETGVWVGRLGRYALIEDSNGIVYRVRTGATTAAEFDRWMVEYFGADHALFHPFDDDEVAQ